MHIASFVFVFTCTSPFLFQYSYALVASFVFVWSFSDIYQSNRYSFPAPSSVWVPTTLRSSSVNSTSVLSST